LDATRTDQYLSRLDAIEAEVNATSMPNWLSEQVYLLRAAIDLVRERLGTPQAKAIPGFRERSRDGAGLGTTAGPA
jgi:hypothetical protein